MKTDFSRKVWKDEIVSENIKIEVFCLWKYGGVSQQMYRRNLSPPSSWLRNKPSKNPTRSSSLISRKILLFISTAVRTEKASILKLILKYYLGCELALPDEGWHSQTDCCKLGYEPHIPWKPTDFLKCMSDSQLLRIDSLTTQVLLWNKHYIFFWYSSF
jgi:hypothetical protein